MAKMTVLVCDKCGAQEDVETWNVRKGAESAALDLCGACSAPMAELLTLAPKTAPVRAPRTRSSSQRAKVTTIEEIEAMKKAKTQ